MPLTAVDSERTLGRVVAARIALLGPLAVDGGEVGLGPRDRVVLTALATHPGDVVSKERLADALWGERPPESWSTVVSGCVLRLRRALGVGAIETTPHGYRLAVGAGDLDAIRFEREIDRGRELLTLGEAERAAFVVGEALALWRGPPLADADRWEPARIEAARLEQLRLDAEELRVDACLQAGRFREVLADVQALVAAEPLRERRWALLSLARYQAGRQGEALRTLRQARRVLAEELGIDPGPELVEMEQAILRQDPALLAAEAASKETVAWCPYRGLVPFDVADADRFFGRDVEVGECLRRLADVRVVAVVGASGSGKSSLVRAGVAAALERDGRRVAIITPGVHPLDSPGDLPANGDTVLIVDQCEEAVSLCTDIAEQARFFGALADRAERSPVVVAVRADRLADVSTFPAFVRMVERGLFLLGAMSEEDLRAAIEGPARRVGLLIEPGLIDVMVREVEGEPGALPLLSHALRQTWERREGRTLTVAGYRASGGIRGAVALSAELVWEQVPADQQATLRDLLMRLVTAGADGEPMRCPLPRRSIPADADHGELIERLVAARLATSDDESVELAHEALARAWPRLRGWLDDDVAGQRVFRHLAGVADAWDQMGRPDSELYRGIRLTQALDWQRHATTELTPTERDFLDTSRHHAERDARRLRRVKRRRRTALAGVTVLIAAAVATGVVAVRQGERADTASAAADARRASTFARDTDQVDQALLLAAEAVRLDDSPDTRASLLAALNRHPSLAAVARHEHRILELAVNPRDGSVAIGDTQAG